MIFTSTAKAELIAFIQSLDPSIDITPYQERITELEAVVATQSQQIADLNAKIAAARAALE